MELVLAKACFLEPLCLALDVIPVLATARNAMELEPPSERISHALSVPLE